MSKYRIPFRDEDELRESAAPGILEGGGHSEFSDMIKYVRQEIARQAGADRDIEDEDDFNPDWVVPPGATIQEWLDETGLSRKKFITLSNLSAKQVDDLINGDLTINQDIANMLSRTIGSTSAFWVSLEKNYRDGLIAGKIKV